MVLRHRAVCVGDHSTAEGWNRHRWLLHPRDDLDEVAVRQRGFPCIQFDDSNNGKKKERTIKKHFFIATRFTTSVTLQVS